MIRNVFISAITAVPLTVFTDFSEYIFQDWEFAKWIAVLIVIDTVLGIAKHLMHKDASSEDFWSGFSKKLMVYIILLIMSNVLANYTIDGEKMGVTSWMSDYLCVFMMVREVISILENINAVYPILPVELIKRFKDFGEDGGYIKKGE